MTIQEIHNFMLLILDKEINGWVSPPDIDSALDRASSATFKQMVPYYVENQSFADALAPFIVSYVFTNSTSPGGLVTLPSNYVHLKGISITSFDNIRETSVSESVEIVNTDELAERKKSQLKPLTLTMPVAHWVGKGQFQLYPKQPNVGECWYLKKPNAPVFGYSQSGRTITYLPNSSVQLEWGELELNNIIFRALQLLGVNLSDEQIIQYTQLKLQDA